MRSDSGQLRTACPSSAYTTPPFLGVIPPIRASWREPVAISSPAMGTLTYDSKLAVSFDDRILAHLQVVIWSKLRRGEHFSFTWTEPSRSGFGRTSIWLAPSIPLTFEYFGGRQP